MQTNVIKQNLSTVHTCIYTSITFFKIIVAVLNIYFRCIFQNKSLISIEHHLLTIADNTGQSWWTKNISVKILLSFLHLASI